MVLGPTDIILHAQAWLLLRMKKNKKFGIAVRSVRNKAIKVKRQTKVKSAGRNSKTVHNVPLQVEKYGPFKSWRQLHNYCCGMRKVLVKPKFRESWGRPVNQYKNKFAKKYYREVGTWHANMETVHSKRYREWRDAHMFKTRSGVPSTR